jgi:hypothetical protein
MLKECGIETPRSGKGGAPRAPHHNTPAAKPAATAHGSSAPNKAETKLGNIVAPRCENIEDVFGVARSIEALFGSFINQNSKVLTGDEGAIVRDALIACRKALGEAIKVHADPKAAKRRELQAALAALDAAA